MQSRLHKTPSSGSFYCLFTAGTASKIIKLYNLHTTVSTKGVTVACKPHGLQDHLINVFIANRADEFVFPQMSPPVTSQDS